MKTLLRSSLVALMLLGGYAGFAASSTSQHVPTMPTPTQPPVR
ncbi:MAG TPA: hypothetical protein VGK24_08160 [Candidatus Angelobacter sp.]